MSDNAKEYLKRQEFEFDHFFELSRTSINPNYKTISEFAESYHKEQMEKVLERAEKEIYKMNEYHVIQNPTDYDYRDVEGARKVFNGAKWLLEQLRKEL
ncbi:hypothetical protein J0X14_14315 [Muricauda sp. CAU 1633]|uniref:hypothetical protein n=1 Tax=Allomuricauda sp. CAU 1633 TaxID=2816036 RepID=UPI001A8E8D7A|nr:hypothetical protein [Muricauda sp. CAU 1633]MBO0323479.1 hypothetical protein [Muricauda sp. CAU 1633]